MPQKRNYHDTVYKKTNKFKKQKEKKNTGQELQQYNSKCQWRGWAGRVQQVLINDWLHRNWRNDQFHCTRCTGSKMMWWMPYGKAHDFYSSWIHWYYKHWKLACIYICKYAGLVWVFSYRPTLMSSFKQCQVFFSIPHLCRERHLHSFRLGAPLTYSLTQSLTHSFAALHMGQPFKHLILWHKVSLVVSSDRMTKPSSGEENGLLSKNKTPNPWYAWLHFHKLIPEISRLTSSSDQRESEKRQVGWKSVGGKKGKKKTSSQRRVQEREQCQQASDRAAIIPYLTWCQTSGNK